MIICNIQGGLGNQMFQYAMGRSLSLERNTEVKYCIDSFNQYRSHNGYELSKIFNINTPIASTADLKKVLGAIRSTPFARRLLAKSPLQSLRGKGYRAESAPGFDKDLLLNLDSECYFHGYWQSEKYFLRYADIIRDAFTFSQPLSQKNHELLAQISSCNAVSLHVRRGDYLANPKALGLHGVCGMDYYHRAIENIHSASTNARFFVFTDDPVWANSELLNFYPDMVLIDHNVGAESFNDMRLMSACSHHIIANSSFSWWGAWLNPSNKKIVIAPKKWFANGTLPRDLLPYAWKRL